MQLTRNDFIWLYQNGNRTYKDVLFDIDERPYVVMFNPHKKDEDRVYIGKPIKPDCFVCADHLTYIFGREVLVRK